MALRVIETRQLLYIISMFMIVQFLGLLIATQAFSGLTVSSLNAVQVESSFSGGLTYITYVIGIIAIASVVLVLLFKFIKTDYLFILLEVYILMVAGSLFFLFMLAILTGSATQIPVYLNYPPLLLTAGAVVCALMVTALKLKWSRLRNVTAIIASVGIGVSIGIIFPFWLALAFMGLLAVYDFIAVFITKHMITLANAAVSKNLSLMIMANEIKAVPLASLSKAELKEYHEAIKGKAKGPISDAVISSGMIPLPASPGLGTGDLMAPLILAVSAYTVHLNFTLSFVVVLGSILGLCLTMYVLKKYKRPLPAIPFLLFGILVALGAFFIITAI